MSLHLIGETLDKPRSHYRAEAGPLIQLMRGIYLDAGDDAEAGRGRNCIEFATRSQACRCDEEGQSP